MMTGEWYELPPAVYPTGGIVVCGFKKTELDKQMERWAKEPRCECAVCKRQRWTVTSGARTSWSVEA